MKRVDHASGLTTLHFDTLSTLPHVVHFITTRTGGVSELQYRSLNLGYHVGDHPDRVTHNRRSVCRTMDVPTDGLTVGRQTHSANVAVVGQTERGRGALSEATALVSTDGLVTDLHDTCLLVLVADCVPVLLYDERRRVAAAVHAGWRGTASGIVARAVETMQSRMGCRPSDIFAALGPAIGAEDYVVGDEVAQAVAETLPGQWRQATSRLAPGSWLLDLRHANQLLLESCGVPRDQIELSPDSTLSDTDSFFSARRDGIESGRIGAGIMIGPGG